MITEIAFQLVKYLSEKVAFIDKWAGLVVPMKLMVMTEEKTLPVVASFTLPCDNEECTGYVGSDYMDLVPDSKKISVCYVEKASDVVLEPLTVGVMLANVDLQVVLWYNLDLINNGEYLDEGVIAHSIVSNIPKMLPDSMFLYSKNVNFYITGTQGGAPLFDKYSYEEVRTQFVTFPYGAIAVNVNVQYIVTQCAFNFTPIAACGNE